MTHYRPPGSVHAKLLDILQTLDHAEIAAAGLKVDTIQKWSVPGDRSEMPFWAAASLDALLVRAGKPAWFGPKMAEMMAAALDGAAPTPGAVDLNRDLRRVMSEVGQLADVADRAMEDGHLSPHERRELAKQAQEVADRAIIIRDAVEPPAAVVRVHVREGA